MAHMDQEHANKYLPDIIEVNKLLTRDDGWLENRISAFNKNGKLAFVQNMSNNGPNKQHCHDKSQKASDMNGRVS